MMKRGIGEHHAQGLLKRRNAWGKRRTFFPVEDDNGSLRTAQEPLLLILDVTVRLHFFHVAAHDGKGLVLSELSGSQGRDGAMVFSAANQMKTPDPFDRHDRALQEEVKGPVQSISRKGFSLSIHQSQGRPASRAGIGLGVKPTVHRILIFPTADRAHGERIHGCLVTIIGNVFDDGESRAAESAVDEGIAVPEVAGGEEFCQARITGGHIGRDEGKSLRGFLALPDFETGVTLGLGGDGLEGFNPGKRRGKPDQPLNEEIESLILTLRIDEHSLFIVKDPSPDGMGQGQIVNKGSVSNALNDAGYFNGFSFHTPIILSDLLLQQLCLIITTRGSGD